MEGLIVSPRPKVLAATGRAEKPEQLEHPATVPTFVPVKISDSGALVLEPGQTEDAYIKQLQKLRHSREVLQKAGYVMQPLTELDLDQKRKCARCHKCESVRLCVIPTRGCHNSHGLDRHLQTCIQAHF